MIYSRLQRIFYRFSALLDMDLTLFLSAEVTFISINKKFPRREIKEAVRKETNLQVVNWFWTVFHALPSINFSLLWLCGFGRPDTRR